MAFHGYELWNMTEPNGLLGKTDLGIPVVIPSCKQLTICSNRIVFLWAQTDMATQWWKYDGRGPVPLAGRHKIGRREVHSPGRHLALQWRTLFQRG